jgi:hypothetical protein
VAVLQQARLDNVEIGDITGVEITPSGPAPG